MNKINPLYIFGFFAMAAVLMVYRSSAIEADIAAQAQTNAGMQIEGKKLAALKAQWKDPQAAQKKIDAVLGLRQLKNKVDTREKKAGVYTVELKALSAQQLNMMSGKLLNEAISVKALKLTRNGDNNVTAMWEFEL